MPRVGDVLPLVGCGNAQVGPGNCFAHSSLENFTGPRGRANLSSASFFGGSPGGGGGTSENRFVSLVDERMLPFGEGISSLRPLRSKGFGCAFEEDGPLCAVEGGAGRALPMGERFEGLLERLMVRFMGGAWFELA